MNTASPVIPQTQSPGVPDQWPGNPGSATDADHTNWSTQYGYGRPNIGAATKLIMSGKVPPTAELELAALVRLRRPRAPKLPSDTRSASPRAPGARRAFGGSSSGRWATTPTTRTSTRSRRGHGAAHGTLGTLDLSQIPRSYASKTPGSTLPPDGPDQYAVTLRIRALDGDGLKAEDRRSFNARHDPKLRGRLPEIDRHRDERRAHLRRPRGASPARPRVRHLRRRRPCAAAQRLGGAGLPGSHEEARRDRSQRPGGLPGGVVSERSEAARRP